MFQIKTFNLVGYFNFSWYPIHFKKKKKNTTLQNKTISNASVTFFISIFLKYMKIKDVRGV